MNKAQLDTAKHTLGRGSPAASAEIGCIIILTRTEVAELARACLSNCRSRRKRKSPFVPFKAIGGAGKEPTVWLRQASCTGRLLLARFARTEVLEPAWALAP